MVLGFYMDSRRSENRTFNPIILEHGCIFSMRISTHSTHRTRQSEWRTRPVHFSAHYLAIALVLLLAGCGNKGDLFLPIDPEVAQELEEAAERLKKKKEEEEAEQ